MMKDLTLYNNSWTKLRLKVEKKIKGRCVINNKGWRRLKHWHLEEYLKIHNNPFGFLCKVRTMYPIIFRAQAGMHYQYKQHLFNQNTGIDTYEIWRTIQSNK